MKLTSQFGRSIRSVGWGRKGPVDWSGQISIEEFRPFSDQLIWRGPVFASFVFTLVK